MFSCFVELTKHFKILNSLLSSHTLPKKVKQIVLKKLFSGAKRSKIAHMKTSLATKFANFFGN
jgi:hypothetical protein